MHTLPLSVSSMHSFFSPFVRQHGARKYSETQSIAKKVQKCPLFSVQEIGQTKHIHMPGKEEGVHFAKLSFAV